MSIGPHLRDKLKTLKLSGILLTLDARLTLIQNGEIGAMEFLDLLLQDEIKRRNAAALERGVHRASFPDHKTLEGFDFLTVPTLKATAVRDLATGAFIDRRESVILYGPTGVGKTHLAQGLGHIACRQGRRVLFTQVSKALRALMSTSSRSAPMTWLCRCND